MSSHQNQLIRSFDPFRFAALKTLTYMLVKKKMGLSAQKPPLTHWYMTHAGHEIKRCRSQNQAPQASRQA